MDRKEAILLAVSRSVDCTDRNERAVYPDTFERTLAEAGYAVVPLEPTEAMKLDGARQLRDSFGWDNQTERANYAYRATIAAARK